MLSVHARADGGSLLGAILARWRNFRSSRASLAELHRLGRNIDFLARDVNLSPSDLHAVAARWPGHADLLRRRLAAQQLDPEGFAPARSAALRDLERVCALCGEQHRCRRGLDADADAWREYCPNAFTIDALQEREPAGSER
jgi:hypothetical protein